MDNTAEEFCVVDQRHIPPDPGILKAIGLNHAFESAVADLIDNSFDAGARNTLVRFVVRKGLVRQILIVDDGRGLSDEEIDDAMMLGRPKEESADSLGYFGIGLKAASFSQANVLTVLSRKAGHGAQGRRLSNDKGRSGFECDVLDEGQVADAIDDMRAGFSIHSGTIVQWELLRNVPKAKDMAVTSKYIEKQRAALVAHLGLIYHRLIESHKLSITFDVDDVDAGDTGMPYKVRQIDPLGYPKTGAAGYPKTMKVLAGSEPISMACHIWPGRSDMINFKLGTEADAYQGFYLYRNDRLLTVGGWCGVQQPSKRLKLARIAIDIEEHLDVFTMSAEKSSVHMVADLVHAIEESKSRDGTEFNKYLEDAELAFKSSNKRTRVRKAILPPGQGLAPMVKREIGRELKFKEGEDSVDIRWKAFDSDDFVEVAYEDRILWLNKSYREALLKGAHGSINDLPMIKALLFLFYESIFRGLAIGARDKDNMTIWQSVLTAAAIAEYNDYHR